MVPLRALLCLAPLSGCNAAVIGGSVGLLGTGAALSLECPGYVSVALRDGQTGIAACNQPVVARSGDREQRLLTCATVGLSEGRWVLRAEAGGEPTVIDVARAEHCERWVYAVELTVHPLLPPTGRRQTAQSSTERWSRTGVRHACRSRSSLAWDPAGDRLACRDETD